MPVRDSWDVPFSFSSDLISVYILRDLVSSAGSSVSQSFSSTLILGDVGRFVLERHRVRVGTFALVEQPL